MTADVISNEDRPTAARSFTGRLATVTQPRRLNKGWYLEVADIENSVCKRVVLQAVRVEHGEPDEWDVLLDNAGQFRLDAWKQDDLGFYARMGV